MHPEKVICQNLVQVGSLIEEDKHKFCTLFAYTFFVDKFFAFSSAVSKSA
jgi:hypothetical protein